MKVDEKILAELSSKYGRKEKVIQIMYEQAKKIGYNAQAIKRLVNQFFE